MFNVAVQTGNLDFKYGIDGAYRLIAEAGFDAVDANVDHLTTYGGILAKDLGPAFVPTLTEAEMLEHFRPWKDAAKKYGLQNYQAHAPFPSLHTELDDPAYNDALTEMLRKTIIGCDFIDCRNLIIHPFFMDYDHTLPAEKEWEVNIDRYSRLAKTAIAHDVTICLENMYTVHKGQIYAAICNDATMAAKYIDTLNEAAGAKCFAFCLDTGHALLASKPIRAFMNELGDRISCFHVHDNDGVGDSHLAPYTGKLDWDDFMGGLKDIGFNKTLSFETFMSCDAVDPELIPETLKYILACGRMFSRRSE